MTHPWFQLSLPPGTVVQKPSAGIVSYPSTTVSAKEECSFKQWSFKKLIAFAFHDVELLRNRIACHEVVDGSKAETFWHYWNDVLWHEWQSPLAQQLKVLLDESLPELASDVLNHLDQELDPIANEFLSAVSSIRYEGKLKDFDRMQYQYHQTFGDHLLAIMLLRFQKIYEWQDYPLEILFIGNVPLCKVSERYESFEKFILLLDYAEFRGFLERCHPDEKRHTTGDLFESMLLILADKGHCRLAFLIVNFVVCLVIDSNIVVIDV